MAWINLFTPQSSLPVLQSAPLSRTPERKESFEPTSPEKKTESRIIASQHFLPSSGSIPLPVWIRPYRPGEQLDDSKERLCVSPLCNAVFMRQGQSDENWGNKRYCCAACWNGKPSIPVSATTDLLQ